MVAEAMHTLYRLGGEEAHVTTPFVASGEHMAPPNRIAGDKMIRNGDLVFIDIGAQWARLLRGHGPDRDLRHAHRRQQEVYTAVYDALPPRRMRCAAGNTNRDVARAVHDAAAEHGLADQFISLFIGHGVGMGANEPPYSASRCAATRP